MKTPKEKSCVVCGKTFTPHSAAHIYCSAECRLAHKNKIASQSYKSIKRFDNASNTFTCSWCGRLFESPRVKKYCCKTCMLIANGMQKQKKADSKPSELARIDRLAKEEGTSYGKYVAKKYIQKLKKEGKY